VVRWAANGKWVGEERAASSDVRFVPQRLGLARPGLTVARAALGLAHPHWASASSERRLDRYFDHFTSIDVFV
jgi:hypothetical protein